MDGGRDGRRDVGMHAVYIYILLTLYISYSIFLFL